MWCVIAFLGGASIGGIFMGLLASGNDPVIQEKLEKEVQT